MMKILVTGASGFIGSFIVEKGLDLGYEVWAGIRASSSREYLKDHRINFIELSFGDRKTLELQLSAFAKEHGKWDYIIHAAGVTKCINKEDFTKINFQGTKNFIDVLLQLQLSPRQFIYLSSLSVYGPVREEQPYTPIKERDIPMPNTAYGNSKLLAEHYIQGLTNFPYVILRPTGVYGPREKDYFQMAVSIKKHIDFSVGYKPQIITFIYVKDLVKAIYLAIDKGVTRRCYFVSEPRGYNSRAFSNYIQEVLGIKGVLHIKAPLWVLKTISMCAELLSRITKRASTLNSDKYNIMKQRNWLCDTTSLENDLGFTADYDLKRGTAETIKWYKENKWL
ncbi:MAG: NAD(P)-dependent oxidoreductase [Bacteroidaceae bacterium]|nr:NAD(P)-dependent oxidoreductase [Bacteroidaceae bacterium]